MTGRIPLTVKMEWNEAQQMWLMKLALNDALLYDFHDCQTVRTAFSGLDKKNPVTYTILIRKA